MCLQLCIISLSVPRCFDQGCGCFILFKIAVFIFLCITRWKSVRNLVHKDPTALIIWIYRRRFIYLCDFTKRCLLSFCLNTVIARHQARVAEKKKKNRQTKRALGVLLGVSRKPRPRPNCWLLAGFFVLKVGGREGKF